MEVEVIRLARIGIGLLLRRLGGTGRMSGYMALRGRRGRGQGVSGKDEG